MHISRATFVIGFSTDTPKAPRTQQIKSNGPYPAKTLPSLCAISPKSKILTEQQIQNYQNEGAILLRNILSPQDIQLIQKGISYNLQHPSIYASENNVGENEGRFFDDYCNWTRIPEFEFLVYHSPLATIAAEIMQSSTCQFFHDHVLVKEPGTLKTSPWHQDAPYYFVEGTQTVSMWIPVDPVQKVSSLRLIAGSHLWKEMVRPVKWDDNSDFYETLSSSSSSYNWLPVPNPDNDENNNNQNHNRILEWDIEPGDLILFHFRTVHGTRGNLAPLHQNQRRRVLSLRWLGDDARYVDRPGTTSPPFPGHQMKQGDKLRMDWFPLIIPPSST